MRLAKIENGKVTNVIVANEVLDGYLVCEDDTSIGYDYDGVTFTKYVGPEEIKSFSELQTAKIKQIQLKYEAERVKAKGVPPEEEKTWDRQKDEYNAYISDNTTPTPAIDGLVAGDNAVGGTITKAELITKIGQNIEKYIVAIAYITGMQHGFERRVKACTTQEELDLIDITFGD